MTETENHESQLFQGFVNGYKTLMRPVANSWRRDHKQVHYDLLEAQSELLPDAKIIEIIEDGVMGSKWKVLTTEGDWTIPQDVGWATRLLAGVRAEIIRKNLGESEQLPAQGLAPQYATRGTADRRDAVVDRNGYALQVQPHGRLTKAEVEFGTDYRVKDDDRNIAYVELRTHWSMGTKHGIHLVTPEAAIALGERLIEEGQVALEVQGQMVRAEQDG